MSEPSEDARRERRVKLDNYAIPAAPRLGVRGWLRWGWRQVTSMRVALILLLLLGLGSIPGSLLPQRPQSPAKVRDFEAANPEVSRWLDAVGMFDVFGSAWFTAIYLLLFASLIGCIVPRAVAHWRELRTPPAAAPRTLARYRDTLTEVEVDDARAALARASAVLRPSGALASVTGYRVRIDDREGASGPEVAMAAEKGHVREIGNLVFHVALIGVLVAAALGQWLTYRGQAIVVEGRAFTNAVVAYDSFEAGRGFDPDSLQGFTLRLDSFDSAFSADAKPLSFRANVTLTEPGVEPRAAPIEVNRPLQVDGAKIYLSGNGYAPVITVRDAAGEVAFSGPVPFLPQDAAYTSTGVVKAPDVSVGEQIGLKATLLPSAVFEDGRAFSVHPDPTTPVIILEAYTGNLGLDEGVPQNVYVLDESQLSPLRDEAGEVATLAIGLGQTVELPDGAGTVTWEALPRFVALDLRADPTLPWMLSSAVAMCLGLALSLFGARRTLWAVASAGDRTVVSVAALAPAHDEHVRSELARVTAALTGAKEDE